MRFSVCFFLVSGYKKKKNRRGRGGEYRRQNNKTIRVVRMIKKLKKKKQSVFSLHPAAAANTRDYFLTNRTRSCRRSVFPYLLCHRYTLLYTPPRAYDFRRKEKKNPRRNIILGVGGGRFFIRNQMLERKKNATLERSTHSI